MENTFRLSCEIETEASKADGTRVTEWSKWDKITAPEGFVINKDKVEIINEVERGSENKYEQVWSDKTELFPGSDIYLPRTMEVRVMARSSKGSFGGGGATRYVFVGNFVELPPSK